MSKVKIQGNASGTGVVTLTAPNTNTDRTITLPDGDITLGGGVDGIVSTANATAITIDASENVGIGTTSPQDLLDISASVPTLRLSDSDGGCYHLIKAPGNGDLRFEADAGNTASGSNMQFTVDGTERLSIEADGRGLSQFTAKAWVNFNGTGTVSIRDSHNVSSITDDNTGNYRVNFSNNMANTNYCEVATCGGSGGSDGDHSFVPININSGGSTSQGRQLRPSNYNGNRTDVINMAYMVFGD